MTTRFAASVIALATLAACRQEPAPPPAASQTKPEKAVPKAAPAAPAASGPATGEADTPSSGALSGIFSAIGAGGMELPKGLVPGGECPAADGDVAAEIAEQAQAVIPLKAGLTFAYAWTKSPQEEYECLIQITRIEHDAIETSASCNVPEQKAPVVKRVCRSDLRHSKLLHTMYGVVKVIGESGNEEPETIVGATAFSVSTDEFAKLQKTGTLLHHYVEVGNSGQLVKDGVGELHVDGREKMRVVVNDQPVEIPVIKLSGRLKWWIRGQRLETTDTAVVLDDARFPVYIDQQSSAESAGSRIKFATITYPGEGNGKGKGAMEEALLEEKHVDVYGIYFDFNSDRIRPESEPVLKEIGGLMQKYPDWRLSIAGHTDNVGGNGNYNLELSRRRSEAVRRALVERFSIAGDRLTSSGYGAGAPKDTNDTPEGRAHNRRVELVRQ